MEHKVYLQDAKEMDALSILAKISKNSHLFDHFVGLALKGLIFTEIFLSYLGIIYDITSKLSQRSQKKTFSFC